MTLSDTHSRKLVSRRGFLTAGAVGVTGLALYAGEIERHWIEVTQIDIRLKGLPAAFEGLRIAQLSDIHMDEYTEPFFLRDAVQRINRTQPDVVLLTGDYVSDGPAGRDFAIGAAWQCANILRDLKCSRIYAVLGNHDLAVSVLEVSAALIDNGFTLLRNASLPLERDGSRIWIAGLDDPVNGRPDPERTIPASIRNAINEPIILMCHAPDYIDDLMLHPAGRSAGLVLSGHTHGGQVRLPFLKGFDLPPLGKKYLQGSFQFGETQLYVNRGIGTVGVPFRFNCPPEITQFTLRRA